MVMSAYIRQKENCKPVLGCTNSHRTYKKGGQAQRDLLPKFSPARRFFEKWDHCHLHDLTPAEYEEIAADIEELKTRYNYIEDIRDTFRGSRSSIPFYDIVKLSKMEPKKKGVA